MSHEPKEKPRRITFADIALLLEERAPKQEQHSPVEMLGTGAEKSKRVTFADLAALSKTPRDFKPRVNILAPPVVKSSTTPPVVNRPPALNEREPPRPGELKEISPVSEAPPVLETPPVVNQLLPVLFGTEKGSLRKLESQNAKRFVPLSGARAFRGRVAQDGHTQAEQAIYAALWNSVPGDSAYKDVSLGNRYLINKTGLSERTVQLNLQTLQLKLAIEVVTQYNADQNQPRTYRVYSYTSILRRRREAGLEWVQTKRGGGVRLITDPSTTPPVDVQRGNLHTRGVSNTGGGSKTGDPPVSNAGAPPVSKTPLSLGNLQVKTLDKDQALSSVVEALSRYGAADNDAAAEIITKARLNAPTATEEEIVHFIHQKGSVTLSGKIDNPIGYLIVYVPKCFIGDTLQRYRDQERRRREAAEQETAEAQAWAAEHRREQEQILADPNASEEDKRWAHVFLSGEGN